MRGIVKVLPLPPAIRSILNIQNGTKATIQVVTNGDPNGGLYNCADTTFSSTAQPGPCTNGTGVTATKYTGANMNANGTDSSNTTASTTGTAATASPTIGAAGSLRVGLWSVVTGGAFVAALV